jgi:plastocyanin
MTRARVRNLLFPLALLLAVSASPMQNRSATVTIADGQFSPSQVSVAVGESVTWVNRDQRDHSIVADDNSFSSGNLKPGRSFAKQFTTPGTLGYRCTLHPRERGSVTVKQP